MTDRTLTLDLLARDQTGSAPKRVADKLEDVADAADHASKNTDRLKDSTDKLTESNNQATSRLSGLDSNIKSVRQNLVFMHQAMADAADESERFDIGKGIRKAEADLRRLTKSRDALKDLMPKPDAKGFLTQLGTGIAEGASGLAARAASSLGPTVGVAVGAAVAPVLLSATASALSVGAGGGILGAGVAAAIKNDTQLQIAGKQLGIRFISGIQDAATDSLKGPILESIAVLGSAGDVATAKLSAAFGKLGPSLKPLITDLATAAQVLVGAFADAAGRSGPALAGLGDTIVLLSQGVSDFVSIVADGGPEAAANLTLIAGVTGDVVRQTGLLIKVFNDVSQNGWLTGGLLPLLRDHYKDAADGADELARKQRDAAEAADTQKKSLEQLADELRAETDPVFALMKANTDLGEARTRLGKATRKYGADSAEARAELNKMAEASIDLQTATGELGGSFTGKLSPSLRTTLQSAGLTKNEINRLEGEFGQAKRAGDRFADDYVANARVNGVKQARTDLYALQRIANNIDGRVVSIAMRVTGASRAASQLALQKQYEARAGGGPVKANRAYIVGEHRAEIFVPDKDGQIIPSIEQYNRKGGSPVASAFTGRSSSDGAPRSLTLSIMGGGSNDFLWQMINYGFRNGLISAVAS